jgi:hypothetical protein
MTAHCRERPADCCRSGPLFRCAGKGRNGCASRAHQITPDARGDESTIRRWARDTRLHVQEGQTGGQGCFATSVLMLPRAGSSSALQHRGPSKHRLRVILPASPTTTAHIHGTTLSMQLHQTLTTAAQHTQELPHICWLLNRVAAASSQWLSLGQVTQNPSRIQAELLSTPHA